MDLAYFNIGFRAENSKSALEKIKRREKPTTNSIQDALEIVTIMYEMSQGNSIKHLGDKFEAYSHLLYPDLELLKNNPEREEILLKRKENLKRTYNLIRSLSKGEEILGQDLEIGVEFFSQLSQNCISQSITKRCPRLFF